MNVFAPAPPTLFISFHSKPSVRGISPSDVSHVVSRLLGTVIEGVAFSTVTSTVSVNSPTVAVNVAVPRPTALNFPSQSFLTTLSSDDDHTTVLLSVVFVGL